MLLQKLREYSDRLELPPTLYGEGPVRYVVELDGNGRLLNPRLTDLADPSSARTKRGQRRVLPQIQRSSGVRPLLLADKADYVLGYGAEGAKGSRVSACHKAFMDLLEECANATGEASVRAILGFLQDEPLRHVEIDKDFDAGGIITFRVDGMLPIDLPSVQAFWARQNDPAATSAPVMQCVVCGQERPVLDRLQAKIKGVPGGQTSGTSIISANAEAFESYGLRASLIAPTCADCGERFTKALNDLLSSDQHSIRIGGAAFVFWTREETDFNFRTMLSDPQPENVRALIDAARSGRPGANVDATQFYASSLSGSGGRAVVRDWIDTTVAEAKRSLARWFSNQHIVDGWGENQLRPLGLYALAAATVRDPRRDLSESHGRVLTAQLLRGALTGSPLPTSLLHRAVQRSRAEQTVTRPRAALIKLVLQSQHVEVQEGDMVKLDTDSPSLGYQCGRLMAILEQAQRLAIPGIKATIVDRFFGTASSSPASVFPRLLRGAQPHLAKLERDRRGAFIALQRRLEDIQGNIPASGYPRILKLHEQGLFALGYYHQRAFDRAQAVEARQAKDRQATPEAELLPDDDAPDKEEEQ